MFNCPLGHIKMVRLLKLYFYIAVCSICIIIYNIVIYKLYNNIDEYRRGGNLAMVPWKLVNLSCHRSILEDSLPSASDPSFTPLPKAIFFHETSCRGGLDYRQACSVESAARAHPAWGVYLLFSGPVTDSKLKNSSLAKVLEFPNVKIARIHADEYTNGTVVHSIVTKELKYSTFPLQHTADIMRMVTLNKWGGVYLDLDEIVIKPFDSLPNNWIAKESSVEISSGAMAFSKDEIGQNITEAVLKEISDTFDPFGWATNGPKAIDRVLHRICPSEINGLGLCGGVTIFGLELFYPIHYSRAFELFNNGVVLDNEKPYTFHLWNSITKTYNVSNDSPFAKLAQEYCPTIYNMYGTEFGMYND